MQHIYQNAAQNEKNIIFKTNQPETRYNFSSQVRCLREGAGFSIKELAQKTNIFEKHLREIELGKIENIGTIFTLAQFFNQKVEINLL